MDQPSNQESDRELLKRLVDDAGLEDETSDWAEGLRTNLRAHVKRAWESAKRAKEPIERELLRCLRQRNGEYEPGVLRDIQELGGSEIYMMITQVKCRAIESWIRDILFQPGQLPYDVRPTAIPDLPPEGKAAIQQRVANEAQQALSMGLYVTEDQVKQRMEEVEKRVMELATQFAKKRAELMKEKIDDRLEEGGWQDALEEFLNDFCTYPTGFFRGPFRIHKKRLRWMEDQFGEIKPVVGTDKVPMYERLSPWDAFPAADARSTNDGPFIHRIRYRRKALYDLIGLPTYDKDAIELAIEDYGDAGYELVTSHDNQREQLEGRDHEDWSTDKPIEAISYWGAVRGQLLLDWGMPAHMVPDPHDDYEANVIVVGEYVIRAALNPHPLGRRPFDFASFERINGQIWGKGPPQIIRDVQDMANNAARSLANNMALASGPMGDVNIDRLADGETLDDIHPWRLFQTTESKAGNTAQRAINFFSVDSHASEIMEVFKFFSSLADEYSGIPPYAQGQPTTGGAADTATGLSILMEQAARGIKYAVKQIDKVIRSSVRATWEDIMLYDPNQDIKGDAQIVARASSALMHKEKQAMRQTELLNATNNPVDQAIIQLKGRRKQLENIYRAYDLDPEEILPSEDELRAQMMQQQMAQQQMAAEEDGGKEPKNVTADGRRPGGPQPAERANAA